MIPPFLRAISSAIAFTISGEYIDVMLRISFNCGDLCAIIVNLWCECGCLCLFWLFQITVRFSWVFFKTVWFSWVFSKTVWFCSFFRTTELTNWLFCVFFCTVVPIRCTVAPVRCAVAPVRSFRHKKRSTL